MYPGHATAIRWMLILGAAASGLRAQEAKVLTAEGTVLVTKAEQDPMPARPDMHLALRDHLGTGSASRAVLQMSQRWRARIDEQTDVEITPGAIGARGKEAISVALGGIFVYSREEEGELKIVTPSATGGLRGTQLVVRVFADGRTVMQVLEGEVDLANEHGQVLLRSGEAGEAERGLAPRKTAVIETRNLLQWALYYPAILTPEEFGLSADEQREVAASLAAYRQGDLLAALGQYPSTAPSSSPGTSVYRAAVLLATGRVEAARESLAGVPAENPGRRALERMIAAVQFREQPAWREPATAGEAMAESYYRQSRSELITARAAARRATELAPASGFAWARLAELEFSFGDTRAAGAALEKGIAATPRNAQAHALRGYLLSAENQLAEARAAFEKALGVDGGLGNAWLGLGLIRIKQGDQAGGLADLQTAAAVEPTRSAFYSYHGKALSSEGLDALAAKDLALARQIDPSDPTPWLYSSILSQQGNRYNDAIGEMAESLRLNDNRQVYRSRFLLDQDRAVRNTNLALIYQHNGMTDLSLREATRAVDSDYANASAHLFLANSFDALRDPTRQLLRYETAWFNELLLANLLSPVGGGPLSQYVSQQEYSRLLESDGLGGNVTAEARDGGYLDVQASLFGTQGRFSAGIDYLYHYDPGTRPNNDMKLQEIFLQSKFQATPDDVVYGLVKWSKRTSGDLLLTTDNQPTSLSARIDETQAPGLLLVGWNHRWAPGVHTLVLGGRLAGEQDQSQAAASFNVYLRDPATLQQGFYTLTPTGGFVYDSPELQNATTPPVGLDPNGSLQLSSDFQREIAPFLGEGPFVGALAPRQFDLSRQSEFTIHSAELQQIWGTNRQTLLVGGRWQTGEFDTRVRLTTPTISALLTSPAADQSVTSDFERRSAYAYEFFNVTPALTLIAGGAWDELEWPDNFRRPPINDRQRKTDRFSGKAGFTYAPGARFAVRGAYTESQGGVTFDESIRLEPVQFAGFNQAFRTVISESVAGSVEAPVYRNLGLTVEGALPTRTWWSITGSRLQEDVERTLGAWDVVNGPMFPGFGFALLPGGTLEQLEYTEKTLLVTLTQLVGTEFALGTNYRRIEAEMVRTLPQALSANNSTRDEAALDELAFHANWNSPRGWFASAEAAWFNQHVTASSFGGLTADDFWQVNARFGYRFFRNQCEVSAGLLNLTDTDYQLNALTYVRQLPRERTFFARCRFGF